MHVIADLEVHSRFARAVSPDMNVENLEKWGVIKGIKLIGTGDFTHPTWLAELKKDLEPAEPGLFKRRGSATEIRFMLSAEVSCIYGKGGATRRVHVLLYAPSFEIVEAINAQLSWIGKLKSDGRPIIGMDAKDLARIVLEASPDCLVIPAHVWTPWFSLFGSKSGFDKLTDCFEEYSDKIAAVETGLSSDPPMNWRLQQLDTKSIVSFSDAHSPANIGREATVFELASLSYANVAEAIRLPQPTGTEPNRIAFTIEFHPEEGMYHWDGHRNCNIRWSPDETKSHNNICTVCGKPVTVGVLYRSEDLADRPKDFLPPNRPDFKSIIPLPEIIGEAIGVGKKSKAVDLQYQQLITAGKNEFNILLDMAIDDVREITTPRIAEAINRMRHKKLHILPGYDGVYGTVTIFEDNEKETVGQVSLF